jgi:hypothetical protein
MTKKYANSIFDIMGAIDVNDLGYYNKLTDAKRKELEKNMWLMMKYCSAVEKPVHSESYLILTHKVVNVNFMKLQDHPALLWKLMSMCGSGSKQYHYLPAMAKRGKTDRRREILSQILPEYRASELDHIINTTDRDTIIEWCNEYGFEEAGEIF